MIAIEGEIEEGDIQAGGFIAVSEGEDQAYVCDSGTIRFFDGPASEIKVESDGEGEVASALGCGASAGIFP